jgi:hypothetical protein
LFLFLIGYQVAQGFSAIQDGFDQCFPQEGVLIWDQSMDGYFVFLVWKCPEYLKLG